MNYLLILLSIVIFTVQTLCFKEFSSRFMKNLASYFVFNSFYFGIVVAIFLFLKGNFTGFDYITVILGVTFGIGFIASMLCYMKAMGMGPLSYTSLIFSFGIIVPVIVGLIFWNENVNLFQVLGLVLLLVTFYLGSGSSGSNEAGINLKWLFLCIAAFIGNGMLMVVSKWHQIFLPGEQIKEFLIIAFGTAAALSFILFLFQRLVKKQAVGHLWRYCFYLLAIGAGVSTAFGNQLALYLNTRIPSIIQFPSVSGGTVIFSAVASGIFFRERFTKKGIAGLGIGILALLLLSAR
jgi:drug/metabolite transporter (DMT)-like permease